MGVKGLVLGIETSCDETAVALVSSDAACGERILFDSVRSQAERLAPYGGVVPEIAARAHVEWLDYLLDAALRSGSFASDDLGAIAVTSGPGLFGCLSVGLSAAKGLSLGFGVPLLPINHLEGHALTARLTSDLDFPFLALLLSGGHSLFVAVEGVGRYVRLGTTLDDAAGEAFDKVGKWLGLGYPGGPALERAARDGDPDRFVFPHPLKGELTPNFSFSGLKTAVRHAGEKASPLGVQEVADLCASFQATVVEILLERLEAAYSLWSERYGVGCARLVVSGGVAANGAIRKALGDRNAASDIATYFPPLGLCGDNAAMIAWAGAERLSIGALSEPDAPVRIRWPLGA